MTPDITKLCAEMRAGLEGVMPGAWEVAARGTYPPDEGEKVMGPQGTNSFGRPVRYYVAQFVKDEAAAAHIARCSPDTIRALLDHIAALEARLATEGAGGAEPVGWTFEFLGYDGKWGRDFRFHDQGEPTNGGGAIIRNVVPLGRIS